MKRREAIKGLSVLPIAGVFGNSSLQKVITSKDTKSAPKAVKSTYESIGVRPVINARGTITVLGASRILPEVQKAMDEAVLNYVQIDELMDGVGRRLAELTGAESGCITAGASAALTAATAGCVTGGDPDKIWIIPDLTGMKDEVIIPAYSRSAYDAAARAVGVRMVQVSDMNELRNALGPRTAMIMVLAGNRSEEGPMSLREISSLAKPHGIPVVVDAAAEGLEVPNPHIMQGADLVAYSGGKYLNGPQCAGLLIGRKDLIMAARMNTGPHHGFGRGFKVGREEIMGMLTAVEMWFKRNHEAEKEKWTSRLQYVADRLKNIPGVSVSIRQTAGRSNPSPNLTVQWDESKIDITGRDAEKLLWDGNPRVAVSGAGSFLPFPPNMKPEITINSSQLADGDEKIIAERVYEILSKPPVINKPAGQPAFDIRGQWDLEMKFYASIVKQNLVIEQKENDLQGTHFAAIGKRDLKGSLYGNEIVMRSSYTEGGARINMEFTGKVTGDTMEGEASLSEYGIAEWKASRHSYR
ncbi:MAG TPA: aminotransferase class V-fold PLP-dependent enzyme [Bacteroidales bacterium]|nr:aminotransferase class V-fold PLP-dependent enzyme [Bacteroidales bacterium]